MTNLKIKEMNKEVNTLQFLVWKCQEKAQTIVASAEAEYDFWEWLTEVAQFELNALENDESISEEELDKAYANWEVLMYRFHVAEDYLDNAKWNIRDFLDELGQNLLTIGEIAYNH